MGSIPAPSNGNSRAGSRELSRAGLFSCGLALCEWAPINGLPPRKVVDIRDIARDIDLGDLGSLSARRNHIQKSS